MASVSYITSEHILKWDIGWQFCFLSYFLTGYKIRQWGKNKRNNKTALLLILAGMVINAMLAATNYCRGLKGLPIDVTQYYRNPISYMPLAPIEVIASCLIFAGFSVLKIKRDFSKLAGCTFLIYLFHMGVLDIIYTLIENRLIGNQVIETMLVIIISMGAFCVSLIAAIAWNRVVEGRRKSCRR